MGKDALIVLSGGMDSTTMLYDYADSIALAVNFSYGANHNEREAACARENCRRLGIELVEIDLAFMGRYFESSLLSGADAIPEGHYEDENMRSTVVPFRNGIMLSIAAGLAESRGLKAVMIANHGGGLPGQDRAGGRISGGSPRAGAGFAGAQRLREKYAFADPAGPFAAAWRGNSAGREVPGELQPPGSRPENRLSAPVPGGAQHHSPADGPPRAVSLSVLSTALPAGGS